MMRLPKTIGPLTLQQKLSQGGLAETYLAILLPEGESRVVARRVLPHVRRDPARMAELEDRVRALADVNHPLLVSLKGVMGEPGEDDRFVVEAFVEGVDLGRVLAFYRTQGVKPPPELSLTIATQICNALEAMHSRPGVGDDEFLLHLGIRPGAIFLTDAGEVITGGFGLARSPLAASQGGVVPASPRRVAYLSPEQSTPDQRLSPASDIFSLGALLYELFTQELLFGSESTLQTVHRIRRAELGDAMDRARAEMPGLERVLQRSLSLNPRHRYQRAFVVREDLRGLMAGFDLLDITHRLADLVAEVKAAGPGLLATAPQPQMRSEDPLLEPPPATALSAPPSGRSLDAPIPSPLEPPPLPTGLAPPRAAPQAVLAGDVENTDLGLSPLPAGDPEDYTDLGMSLLPADEEEELSGPVAPAGGGLGLRVGVPRGRAGEEEALPVLEDRVAPDAVLDRAGAAALDAGVLDDEVVTVDVGSSEAERILDLILASEDEEALLPDEEEAAPEDEDLPLAAQGPPISTPPSAAVPDAAKGPYSTEVLFEASLISRMELPEDPGPPERQAPPAVAAPPVAAPPAPTPPAPTPPAPTPPAPAVAAPPAPTPPAPTRLKDVPTPPPVVTVRPPPVRPAPPPASEEADEPAPPRASRGGLWLGASLGALVLFSVICGVGLYLASDRVGNMVGGEPAPEPLAARAPLEATGSEAAPQPPAPIAPPGVEEAAPPVAAASPESPAAAPPEAPTAPASPTVAASTPRAAPVAAAPAPPRETPAPRALSGPSVTSSSSDILSSRSTTTSPSASRGSAPREPVPAPPSIVEEAIVDATLDSPSGLLDDATRAVDLDGFADAASKGRLSTADVATLERVSPAEADYTRSRSLLLMDARQKKDATSERRYLDQIMAVPENQYNPIFLTEVARAAVNQKRYDVALRESERAERYWARLPSELVFSKKAEIYEIQATAAQGLFYKSNQDLELLDEAIRRWQRYRDHVAARDATALVARADRALGQLRTYRDRLQ